MGFFDRFTKKTTTPLVQTPPRPLETDVMELWSYVSNDAPKVYETKANDWVLFGPNNQFPIELLTLRNNSGIHSSIIDAKTKLITGNGIIFGKTREESNNWIADNFRSVPFYSKLDKVFYQVTRDQMTFGYSCFEVIYSMDRTRILDINWVDASRIASGKKCDETFTVDEYYYCTDWRNTRQNVPVEIAAYNPNGEDKRELVFIRYEENNMDYYALPSYYAAYKWIKADAMMADYNCAALKNGFSPSIVFKFYKKPTPQERQMNAEGIKAQHGGSSNAGKALIFYSDGKELAPDIQTLDATNIDERLITVADQIVQQIISAHRANPSLLGIAIPGKLGYSQELVNSWKIFDSQVIQPERKLILDAFKQVLMFNGVTNAQVDEIQMNMQ